MKLVFRPEAKKELLNARTRYDELSPGLGLEFARAVDAAIEKVIRVPQAFPLIEGKFRRIIIRKFPYSIIYSQAETEIVVVSCFHHRRKPDAWLSNVNDK